MTIDTNKLSQDIVRIMEFDAKRTQGSAIPVMVGGISERGISKLALEDEIPLMAEIIRQQSAVIRELREALLNTDCYCDCAQCIRCEALALSAPLVEE